MVAKVMPMQKENATMKSAKVQSPIDSYEHGDLLMQLRYLRTAGILLEEQRSGRLMDQRLFSDTQI